MKYSLLPLIGSLAAGLLAVGLAGNGAAGRHNFRPPFRIVFVDQLAPREQKRFTRPKATRSSIAALRTELTTDPALSRKLRARGIAISDIIGREHAPDGRTIFYVR